MNDITDEAIELEIDRLLSDENYANLMKLEPEFDLFDFLDTLTENASSRALAFLLDSNREHGLGTAFFDAFIENVYREGREKEYRLSLRQRLEISARSTSVTTEWNTSEGRRLDLLIRVYNAEGNLSSVIGIENKHWAEEGVDQLAHYQQEICKKFPDVGERVLLFLAPGARPSLTANPDSLCPHVPCSYQAVTAALKEMEEIAGSEIRVLITSLKNHFDKHLEGSTTMSAKIRELVLSLYRNPKHRNAIKHILNYLPNLSDIVDEIQSRVESHLQSKYIDQAFAFSTYPSKTSHQLQQLHFYPTGLSERTWDNHGIMFYYVLHSDRSLSDATIVPDLDDQVMVQLLVWCKKPSYRERVAPLQLTEKLPIPINTPQALSSYWRALWAGETCKLKDLDQADIHACSELFIQAIDTTFPTLCEIIETHYPLPSNEPDATE